MSNGIKFAYIRVSSEDQNVDRQVDTMRSLGVNDRHILVDKVSGKDTLRPRYQALKEMVRKGDTVIFDSITRMSRNMDDTKREYQWYVAEGIALEFVQEPMLNNVVDSTVGKDVIQRAVSDIILTLLAAFAEKERKDIRQRQAEGIASARKRGKHIGRPRIAYDTLEEEQRKSFHEEYKRWKSGKQTAVQAFTNANLTKSTWYKIVKEYEKAVEK